MAAPRRTTPTSWLPVLKKVTPEMIRLYEKALKEMQTTRYAQGPGLQLLRVALA
jgi:hypothetical protein